MEGRWPFPAGGTNTFPTRPIFAIHGPLFEPWFPSRARCPFTRMQAREALPLRGQDRCARQVVSNTRVFRAAVADRAILQNVFEFQRKTSPEPGRCVFPQDSVNRVNLAAADRRGKAWPIPCGARAAGPVPGGYPQKLPALMLVRLKIAVIELSKLASLPTCTASDVET